MTSELSEFVPFKQFARNYIVLVEPGLQATQRYLELKEIMKSFSYNNPNAFTVFPLAAHYHQYKREITEFVKKTESQNDHPVDGAPLKKPSELIDNCPAVFITISWKLKRECSFITPSADEKNEISAHLGSSVAELDVNIDEYSSPGLHGIDMSALLDEKRTTMFESYSVLKEWYAGYSSADLHRDRWSPVKAAERANAWLVVKPTIFGVGIDVSRIIQDLFFKPPSQQGTRK